MEATPIVWSDEAAATLGDFVVAGVIAPFDWDIVHKRCLIYARNDARVLQRAPVVTVAEFIQAVLFECYGMGDIQMGLSCTWEYGQLGPSEHQKGQQS